MWEIELLGNVTSEVKRAGYPENSHVIPCDPYDTLWSPVGALWPLS